MINIKIAIKARVIVFFLQVAQRPAERMLHIAPLPLRDYSFLFTFSAQSCYSQAVEHPRSLGETYDVTARIPAVRTGRTCLSDSYPYWASFPFAVWTVISDFTAESY